MSHFVLCYNWKRKALPEVPHVKENVSKQQKLNTAAFLTLLVPCQMMRRSG